MTADKETIVVSITMVTTVTIPCIGEAHITTTILGYWYVTTHTNPTPTTTIIPCLSLTIGSAAPLIIVGSLQTRRIAQTLRPALPRPRA